MEICECGLLNTSLAHEYDMISHLKNDSLTDIYQIETEKKRDRMLNLMHNYRNNIANGGEVPEMLNLKAFFDVN